MVKYSTFYPNTVATGVRGSTLPASRTYNRGNWSTIPNGTWLGIGDIVQYNNKNYQVVTAHSRESSTAAPDVNNNYTVFSGDSQAIVVTPDKWAFTYVNGVLNPSPQTITFTATLYNSSGTINWTTVPNVKTGTGTTFTLNNTEIGANRQVIVTATIGAPGGLSQSVIVGKLADPAADPTINNVASAIINQGTLATSNTVNYETQVTGTRPEVNATSSDNLIRNGALVNGTDWNITGTPPGSFIQGANGDPYWYYRAANGSYSVITQPNEFLVSAGETLFISGLIRTAGTFAFDGWVITIDFYNAAGGYIGHGTRIDGNNYSNWLNLGTGSPNTWIFRWFSLAVPANAYRAIISTAPSIYTAGATNEIASLRVARTQPGSTSGAPIGTTIGGIPVISVLPSLDNLISNGNLSTPQNNWSLSANLSFRTGTVGEPPNWIQATGAGDAVPNFDVNAGQGNRLIPVKSGQLLYISNLMKGGGSVSDGWQYYIEYFDTNLNYISAASSNLSVGTTATTWVPVKRTITVPSNAYWARVTISALKYGAGNLGLSAIRISQIEQGATVGADINNVNLYDSGNTGGTITLPRGEVRTSLGIAAGFEDQGLLSTLDSVTYGTQYVSGFGSLAGRTTARVGYEIYRADNSSPITEPEIITSQGIASAIQNQGDLAVLSYVDYATRVTGSTRPDNNATLTGLGSNELIDDTFLSSYWNLAPTTARVQNTGSNGFVGGYSLWALDWTVPLLGTHNPTEVNTQPRLNTVNPGQTYYGSVWLQKNASVPAGLTVSIGIVWLNATLTAEVGARAALDFNTNNLTAGTPPIQLNINGQAPAGAAYARLYLYVPPVAGAAGAIRFERPTFSTAEPGADVTSFIASNPGSPIVIRADTSGVPKSGELSKVVNLSLIRHGINVTSGVVWSVTRLSGNATSTITGTGNGLLTITGPNDSTLSLETQLRIKAVQAGITRTADIKIIRSDDPPTSGASSGSTGGTASSTSTLANTQGTSYLDAASSATITCKAGSNGQVNCTAPLTYRRVATSPAEGNTGCYAKWQWRVPNGTWADIAAEVQDSTVSSTIYDNEFGTYTTEAGTISASATKSSLTPNSDYEFRLLWRRRDVTGTARELMRLSGTLQAAGA